VASPVSSIRSAARGTSSALRRLPIRWRLAGGSAALTLVILLAFALIVGVLTTRRIASDFERQVAVAADGLQRRAIEDLRSSGGRDLEEVLVDYAAPAAQLAAARVVTASEAVIVETGDPSFGPLTERPHEINGWLVETRPLGDSIVGPLYLQYGRRISEIRATAAGVRLLLFLGVLGGTAFALLAGLATAQRAMSPIAELTMTTRRIAAERDPSIRIPHSEADDEVAELARTLEEMLAALDNARNETEAALERQREFVADASHELRTPLTAVLANLELLEEVLEGEPREAAESALRSARRMRRLVADLLLLARADAGRMARHEPLDLSAVLLEAVGEVEAAAGSHDLRVTAPPGVTVVGARDELHRLTLNLLENALRHTEPGTGVEAAVNTVNGRVELSVEDDGPGIPPAMNTKIFERFFRGAGDRSGSSGLGLAIVRAVAESHRGSVSLEAPLDGRGARFVVRLPAA
jgi:two-component system OmpR family sensor kinase